MTRIRVFAKTSNEFRVLGEANTQEQAERMGDRYMFSLDPDTDECPEIEYEPVSARATKLEQVRFRSGI